MTTNNTWRRVLAALLALVLVLGMAGCAGHRDDASEASDEAGTPSAGEAGAQPEEEDPEEPEDDVPEPSGDVVILFTSDVHCGVDQGFGYAGLREVRRYLEDQGDTVLLADNGDAIQGEPIGTMTEGEAIIKLMNKMDYDVATIGNHEFDYGMERFLELADMALFPYVSCNFNLEGETVFAPYTLLEAADKTIAFVGVTTPKTLTSSTPRYFQNEAGEFVYGFFQDEDGSGVYDAVQSAVDDARAAGADHVVVLGHIGNEASCEPWTYGDIISNTTGIDLFLDGHSHDTDHVEVKNADGGIVLRAACGTKLQSIGWARIAADGTLSTGLYTWNNDVPAAELLSLSNNMSSAVEVALGELSDTLDEVVAQSQVGLTVNDPEVTDDAGNPIRMVRRAETNLGDLCADAYRDQSGADVAFVNGGGIRADLPAGDITLGDILSVHPFGNEMCVIEVTGQQILDALEWGARAVPDETGGFLQVSGLTYEIHSYITSSCQQDENGMFVGAWGTRRVRNVRIGGEELVPWETYTLASHNYMLLGSGDGYSMFRDAEVLQENVKLDNQVLIDYITDSLGGVIGEAYADPTGDGRIVIVESR